MMFFYTQVASARRRKACINEELLRLRNSEVKGIKGMYE